MRMTRNDAIDLGLAIVGGLLMRWSFGLYPLWWLAWIAPAPLLAAVLRSTARMALVWSLLAGLIAASANLHYFSTVMPLPAALLSMVMSALLWVLVVCQARRVMKASASPWALLAYPLLWCAADTLLAHLHPDGNWPSLAYSQAGFAPALQITSLLGVAGLVFVLSLAPVVLAAAAVRGRRAVRWPLGMAAVLVAASFGFGVARIPSSPAPQGELVGLASIDDFIGPRVPAAQVERIWSQYERHVEALAGQGAHIVLLPEKIAVLAPDAAALLRQRMARLAVRSQVWLSLGVGIDDGRTTNHQWLFAPDGSLAADYVKHHLAPPERSYATGSAFDVQAINGTRYGLAICKDAHFAEMGRAYAGLGAQALLVPAWDFGEDGEYAARLSAVRGVESGVAMVRASREGLLTISDAYGRVVMEKASGPLPGVTMLGRVPAAAPGATLYSRVGDVFGWLCTVAAILLFAVGWAHRAHAVLAMTGA
ncbi:(R)-stereoselective amidase [Massilia sp. Bi118]|uniref:nitrilase-related carbon-nitrogen hydrolase n=1 Tax=Massilia sp. Bi118 TaxID=2822346 RepID=UPI001DED8ADC|nr:nitrilase-related carbon-nitrogen hydrolase [Massilia sp. Bi118]CAH0141618.1 (R)-stereoselective amidase [Massilia sp. Bi118]